MLNDKIEEAKRKKNVLIARKKRAEAQKSQIHLLQADLQKQESADFIVEQDRMADVQRAQGEVNALILHGGRALRKTAVALVACKQRAIFVVHAGAHDAAFRAQGIQCFGGGLAIVKSERGD